MAENKQKILIVDDDRFIRMALREALSSWGYETIEAGTVADALEQFAEHDPPYVLLDIDLPDGSGIDVLNNIKEQDSDTIAVMITGNVDVGNTVAARFAAVPTILSESRSALRS